MSDKPQSHGPDGRFVKGHSGGPGRPRKVVTAAADALDERAAAAAGDLFTMAFKQAEEGNTTALKMLLDRVWPVGRSRPLAAAMPEDATVVDTLAASTTVTNAVLAGEASVQEGEAIARLLTAHREVVEHHDKVQVIAGMLEERAQDDEAEK
jgi:hypothetical protein